MTLSASRLALAGNEGDFADPTIGLAFSKTRNRQRFAGKGVGSSSGSFHLLLRLCSRRRAIIACNSSPDSNELDSNSCGLLSPRNDR